MKKIMERSVSDYAPQVDDGNFNPEIPPPAYPKTSVPTRLQLAKIISTTVLIVVSLIGLFIITGLYIRSSSPACECDAVAGRRLDEARFEPLIALPSEPKAVIREPMPMQLELNKNIQKMMEKNKKAHVNCVVEKKKATQVIASEPKTLMTPFGNITSDPGITQMVGEKMVISCNTGSKKNPFKKERDNRTIRRRRDSQELCACNCAC